MTFCASRSISLSPFCVVLWFHFVVDSLKWWLHDDNLGKCSRAHGQNRRTLLSAPVPSDNSLSEFVSRRVEVSSPRAVSMKTKALRFARLLCHRSRLDLRHNKLNIHFLFFTWLDDHFEFLLVLSPQPFVFTFWLHEIPSLVLFLLFWWSKETPES